MGREEIKEGRRWSISAGLCWLMQWRTSPSACTGSSTRRTTKSGKLDSGKSSPAPCVGATPGATGAQKSHWGGGARRRAVGQCLGPPPPFSVGTRSVRIQDQALLLGPSGRPAWAEPHGLGYVGLAATTWVPMGSRVPVLSPNDHPNPFRGRRNKYGGCVFVLIFFGGIRLHPFVFVLFVLICAHATAGTEERVCGLA